MVQRNGKDSVSSSRLGAPVAILLPHELYYQSRPGDSRDTTATAVIEILDSIHFIFETLFGVVRAQAEELLAAVHPAMYHIKV